MQASTGVIVGICCYFWGMILVSFLLRNKNKDAEDFLVAGRSFGVFLTPAHSLPACRLGGVIVVAAPGPRHQQQ